MITIKIVSFDELDKSKGFWETLDGLVSEDSTILNLFCCIRDSELYQVYNGETVIGFFTVDHLDSDMVEIHAFIYPEYRKHSIEALHVMEGKFKKNIFTSVWGTHNHVCKILTRMGFVHTGTEKECIRKGGELYDVHYYMKEKLNG